MQACTLTAVGVAFLLSDPQPAVLAHPPSYLALSIIRAAKASRPVHLRDSEEQNHPSTYKPQRYRTAENDNGEPTRVPLHVLSGTRSVHLLVSDLLNE
jgi:hypothetical protein